MDVTRLDAFVRTLMADTAVATEQFAVGQLWNGRVVQALAEERFVIMFGEMRVLAQSSLPLAAGQRISVEVTKAGDAVELRLRSPLAPGQSAAPASPPTLQVLQAAPQPGAPPATSEPPLLPSMPAAARNYSVASVLNGLAALRERGVPDDASVAQAIDVLRQAVLALAARAQATTGLATADIEAMVAEAAGQLATQAPGQSAGQPATQAPGQSAVPPETSQETTAAQPQGTGAATPQAAAGMRGGPPAPAGTQAGVAGQAGEAAATPAGPGVTLQASVTGAPPEPAAGSAPGGAGLPQQPPAGTTPPAIAGAPGQPGSEAAAGTPPQVRAGTEPGAAPVQQMLTQAASANLAAASPTASRPEAALPPADAQALVRLLQPLLSESAPRLTGDALRGWLQNSGLLFEAHVRAALSATPPATSEEAMEAVRSDLRTLLGRLGRALGTGGTAAEDAARTGEPAVAAALGGLAGQAIERDAAGAQAVVADRLLTQQLELAYRWMTDGTLVFEVPVRLFESETRALIQFRREPGRSAGVEPAGEGACAISVHVDSPVLGAVQAAARWRGGRCQAAFFVEHETAREGLAAHLGTLREGLGAVFDEVAIDVTVDQSRARASVPRVEGGRPAGGSIVSVRT